MNKKRIAQIRAYLTFSLAALLLCIPLSGKAQTARLDLHLKQAPLKQAMSEIERQTSYRFVPNIEIDIEYPVSVYAENEPLKTVLDRLFAATPYTYSFLNSTTTILLSKRPQEQPAAVSGLVVDAGGRPVVGASVLVAGTTIGTSTDSEGRFSLSVPSPSTSRLTINFLGYASQNLEIGTRTEFRVVLKEAAEEIDSVVVTALGIKRSEKALAYTVAQVAAEDITMVKDANFINSLSGCEWLYPSGVSLSGDAMLDLVFAVFLPALGAAIVFDIGASTGGTDIVALILAKYTSMEIGKALMVSDILIVLAAAVRFGMGTGLYCILGLIGKSFVVDGAIENIRLRKVCTIMTANPQPILDFIIHDMNRSATVEKAYGAYTHHELSVLVTVLTRRQALQLRNFLRENDPHSFITIVNSSEIIGKGFRSFN